MKEGTAAETTATVPCASRPNRITVPVRARGL